MKHQAIRTKASAWVTFLIEHFDEDRPTKRAIRTLRKALSALQKERFPKKGEEVKLVEFPENKTFDKNGNVIDAENVEVEEQVEKPINEEEEDIDEDLDEELEEEEDDELEVEEEKPKKVKKAKKKKAKKSKK